MTMTETKEIGIDTGIDIGTYHNTEFKDGSIQLKQTAINANGKPIYAMEGYWESNIIDLIGAFKEYDTVALTKTQMTKDIYSIETRTSSDGIAFTEYQALTETSKIQSPKNRYIQVKINFFAGLNVETYIVANFNNAAEKDNWTNSEFLDTSNGLRLKRDYTWTMDVDPTWAEAGSLHRKKIKQSDWKQINSLSIE